MRMQKTHGSQAANMNVLSEDGLNTAVGSKETVFDLIDFLSPQVQCIKGECSASAFVILDGASVVFTSYQLVVREYELGCGLCSGFVASGLAGFRKIPLPSLPPMRTSPIGCILFDKRILRVSALRLNFTRPNYVTHGSTGMVTMQQEGESVGYAWHALYHNTVLYVPPTLFGNTLITIRCTLPRLS